MAYFSSGIFLFGLMTKPLHGFSRSQCKLNCEQVYSKHHL